MGNRTMEIATLICKERISAETNYLDFIHLVKAANKSISYGIFVECPYRGKDKVR